MTKTDDELGIYIHWPYCARICPYCDFNVYKNKKIDGSAWIKSFATELEFWAEKTGPRSLKSIYFGGGTPSLAPPDIVAAVIETCTRLWNADASIEITLESNPTDAEQTRYGDFRDAGVNRLSLGIQSLDDEALKFLGRDHSAADAVAALSSAQAIFSNVSVDLIYALPDQSATQWAEELQSVIAKGVRHLSLYQLTIEPETPFAKAVERGRWKPKEMDPSADLFELTQRITANAGLPAYETSNHAAPGHTSTHNQLYWRYADYLGIGPGAHGRITIDAQKMATEVIKNPADYLRAVAEKKNGLSEFYALSQLDQLYERFAMGLRTTAGIPLYADDYFYEDETRISRLRSLIENGMLSDNCGNLRATTKGRAIIDAVILELFK